MTRTAGIRFDKDLYINVTSEEDALTLYTIDAEGNKQEYEVTPANRRRSKRNTEEK